MFRLTNQFFTSIKKNNFFWTQINKNVTTAQYAVKGQVPTLAQKIERDLIKGNKNYPFKEIVYCSIGNPHLFDQKPLTFPRQVISCVVNPELIDNQTINIDARKRAKRMLQQIGSVGSYSPSLGVYSIRQNVAKFIAKINKVKPPSVNEVILTSGGSQAVSILFQLLITNYNDSVMIPIPLYPMFSAIITMNGGSVTPYYMDQDNDWQISIEEMEREVQISVNLGKKIKALVIISPGNPTGAILSQQTIRNVIIFAVKHRLPIITDHVYRDNIYHDGKQFITFRRVLQTMDQYYRQNCQLASINSTSKGLYGQAGFRSGYLCLYNFNPQAIEQLVKLKSVSLCANVPGQVMVDCMVDPPVGDDVTRQTRDKYLSQRKQILDSLKRRAQIVTKYLNQMDNVHAMQIQATFYSFPRIKFSPKAIQAAKKENIEVDLFFVFNF